MIKNFLYPEGHQNWISGSKVTTILGKGWILPIGVALGRVCDCSLRSRLVFLELVVGGSLINGATPSSFPFIPVLSYNLWKSPFSKDWKSSGIKGMPIFFVLSPCDWQGPGNVTSNTSLGEWGRPLAASQDQYWASRSLHNTLKYWASFQHYKVTSLSTTNIKTGASPKHYKVMGLSTKL